MLPSTLSCDFSIFKTPPFNFTLSPVYITSNNFPTLLSLETKFKTTPVRLINFKSIIRDFYRAKGLSVPKVYNVVDAKLYITIYDRLINRSITMEAQLDGLEYVITTSVPKDGFWRIEFKFEIDILVDGCTHRINIVDDRDFNYSNEPFPSSGIVFPNVRFFKIPISTGNNNNNIIYPTTS